jgi:transcriptional regulator with XRE-family HTH domain
VLSIAVTSILPAAAEASPCARPNKVPLLTCLRGQRYHQDAVSQRNRQNGDFWPYVDPLDNSLDAQIPHVKEARLPQTALGFLLQNLREERRLSLRELAQLADIDHAYIYRLETGAKESPSDEVLSKLIRALKAPKRETDMLRYLAAHPDFDPGLVAFVRQDASVTFDEFASAAGMVFRGAGRPDYATRIARVRRILSEEDDHG